MKKDNLNNLNWDIINNILTDTATEYQKTEFESWLELDKSNKVYFEQIEKTWLKTGSLSHCFSKETDSAWELVKSKTIQKKVKVVKLKRVLYLSISAAASLLLLFYIGKGILFPDKTIISTNNNSIIAYNLPDNSTVDLNHNSELKYNKKFLRKKRELRLTGEAFFDVEKMKDKPFIIHTQHGSFKVLGTSFNITSYNTENLLSLHVKTGIVEFFPKDLKGSIKVKKGEQIHYNKTNRKLRKKQNRTENYIAWKTKNLEFNDETLEEIARILGKTYNIKIIFENDDIKQLRFTGSFNNQSLDKIVKIIALTFELETKYTNEQIKFLKIKNEQKSDQD